MSEKKGNEVKIETAQFLAAIIDSSDDAIITKDLQGTVTSWNRAAERIFGYRAEEMIGQPIALLIPSDRLDEEPAILGRVQQGERIDHYQTIRRRKDGTFVDISLTVSPIKDANGKIVGASKIVRDITEQRHHNERILASEERFRVTLSSIGDAVISTNAQGAITFMNPAAEALTGWTNEEARSVPLSIVFVIINQITRRPVENPVARVMRDGIKVGLANHTVLISKDGFERAIADSAAPIRDQAGHLAGVVLVFRDVTEERTAELDLARLAAIIENSDDAIVGKDLKGVVTSWNKGAEQIFGYTAQEMVGQPILRLIPPERRSEEEQILATLQRGERVDHFETVRMRRDGQRIDVSVTISPIKSGNEIVGASKIARDITGQKQAERALQEAQTQLRAHADELEKKIQERTAKLEETVAELEGFSYSISHDLRAPLRAMQGFSQAVLEGYAHKLDTQGQDFLNRIVHSAARLDRLIQDVLNYSRVVRAAVHLHPVDLDSLFREIITDYPGLQQPRAEITIECPLQPVMGHTAFLTQCISNLLGNAVKFVAPDRKPRVRVRTEARGDKVRVWIEDNGIGISPHHQARIFGLFERIHSSKAYEGTGIGLSIVRKAVERMGGTFGVESAVDQGSKFWFELAQA